MQAGTGFVRDDWWDERVCIAVTPQVAGFTVTTNVTPRPAGVVAYPYVLAAGWAWGVHAPLTSWPERISDSGDPRLTFRPGGTRQASTTGQPTSGLIPSRCIRATGRLKSWCG